MNEGKKLTPRRIVEALDRYIVEQDQAKRAVAIAVRNRWRRHQVDESLQEEIYPKNIIMIGPTGVGKTEIARRLARLTKAPFLKVEASKFTEVGYVGRDVESMVRDLTEIAVVQVRQEHEEQVAELARQNAVEKVLDRLLPQPPVTKQEISPELEYDDKEGDVTGDTFVMVHQQGQDSAQERYKRSRAKMRERLLAGELDEREIELDMPDRSRMPMVEIFSGTGLEEMDINFKDMFGNIFPKKTKKQKVKVAEAMRFFEMEEAQRLIDMEKVQQQALSRVEQDGIIFLDELDKIAGRESGHGPDVSREGVQRDLLPIVEGSNVNTKHGIVRTDHILFIAAGAFNVAKPSDLIPELQGRFPIRVELQSLTVDAFVRILTEPKNALTRQYVALLETEDVKLDFAKNGVRRIAEIATEINHRTEDIGARRLATVIERMLDEVSFNAPEMAGKKVKIDAKFVDNALADIVKDEDLSRYIL